MITARPSDFETEYHFFVVGDHKRHQFLQQLPQVLTASSIFSKKRRNPERNGQRTSAIAYLKTRNSYWKRSDMDIIYSEVAKNPGLYFFIILLLAVLFASCLIFISSNLTPDNKDFIYKIIDTSAKIAQVVVLLITVAFGAYALKKYDYERLKEDVSTLKAEKKVLSGFISMSENQLKSNKHLLEETNRSMNSVIKEKNDLLAEILSHKNEIINYKKIIETRKKEILNLNNDISRLKHKVKTSDIKIRDGQLESCTMLVFMDSAARLAKRLSYRFDILFNGSSMIEYTNEDKDLSCTTIDLIVKAAINNQKAIKTAGIDNKEKLLALIERIVEKNPSNITCDVKISVPSKLERTVILGTGESPTYKNSALEYVEDYCSFMRNIESDVLSRYMKQLRNYLLNIHTNAQKQIAEKK